VSTEPDDADVRRRKLLVRLLVILGIGIPLVIEGLTFAGLVSNQLLDGGEADDPATLTATPAGSRGVAVGDELLPSTEPRETLTTANLRATSESWILTLSVEVDNTANATYQLQLHAVETTGGRTVTDVVTTTVRPGERRTLTGQWALPEGDRPESVRVVAVEGVEGNGSTVTTSETVELAPIPVQGD